MRAHSDDKPEDITCKQHKVHNTRWRCPSSSLRIRLGQGEHVLLLKRPNNDALLRQGHAFDQLRQGDRELIPVVNVHTRSRFSRFPSVSPVRPSWMVLLATRSLCLEGLASCLEVHSLAGQSSEGGVRSGVELPVGVLCSPYLEKCAWSPAPLPRRSSRRSSCCLIISFRYHTSVAYTPDVVEPSPQLDPWPLATYISGWERVYTHLPPTPSQNIGVRHNSTYIIHPSPPLLYNITNFSHNCRSHAPQSLH